MEADFKQQAKPSAMLEESKVNVILEPDSVSIVSIENTL